jgi:hypothetical protein
VCIDVKTGKTLGRLGVVPKGKSHANGTLFTAEGGLMPWRGHGSFCKTRLLDLDPKTGGEIGELADLDYDSSHTMIMHRGRMYFRGQNNLYCYDLRLKR